MSLRAALCYEISRRLMKPPTPRTADYGAYHMWRHQSLSSAWRWFSDTDVADRDVLDFGCGDGELSFYIVLEKNPRTVIGVDLSEPAIARANEMLPKKNLPPHAKVEFRVGTAARIPVRDESIDTIVAFDCLEHVMQPLEIFREWHRVLRPGGKCLLQWFPYKGPWGPHMESLIPIPWAHVIFGQSAMFRAAERIYDLPTFVPRHWDLNERGEKKPNKWRAWSSFKEQDYINELDLARFRSLVKEAALTETRLEAHSFSGSALRRFAGRTLMRLPLIGEYFLSFAVIELTKPQSH